MENTVFKRTEATGEIIGAGMYNLVMGAVLCWGFWVNWLMVGAIDPRSIAQINPIVFMIGYFVCCWGGIAIYTKSDNPWISFLGYNLVVIPFGLIVNVAVHSYNPTIVREAMMMTGTVTAVMMLLGSMFPRFFQRIAGALTIALITVIIVEFVGMIFFKTHHGVLDWIVVLIFCGYIGYDWARANAIPKTMDNAVDSAAALYMDIIILFLRILRIMGRRR